MNSQPNFYKNQQFSSFKSFQSFLESYINTRKFSLNIRDSTEFEVLNKKNKLPEISKTIPRICDSLKYLNLVYKCISGENHRPHQNHCDTPSKTKK